ncbi:two-component system sensor histidine kinase KdpD [Jatrophihabitans sp. GAS493]|uniref:sensor histidine kinase n=1 Tax=Jatrophihabitans sp. GAS493 TaxID=1907575 RepID=UPI000BB8B2C7|nr:ATP-binding protein [Jatrophihabitans sp. GAS493]SOD71649.1 two-component system sensor histidine kinase KdpD [Jatrophihabitans sp. GAS493]
MSSPSRSGQSPVSADPVDAVGSVDPVGFATRRHAGRALLAALMLLSLTVVLILLRKQVSLPSDVTLYLLVVVVTSLIGGFWTAIGSAVAAVLLLNYYFTPPLHTLTVADAQGVVDLVVFVVVAILVSRVVYLAAHRSTLVSRVEHRAATLSMYDQQRTALLNAVGHDLRAPLARAKAAVSSLQASDVQWSDDDRLELLASADLALDQLTDLVTNLLDLSRLQVGAVSVLAGPVGLDDVVSGALAHVATGRTVELSIPDDLPAVQADAALLERVVANLLQNALRYAPTQRPPQVTGEQRGEHVRLSIIDHGPGLPRDSHESIFAPFQRTDDAPVDGAGVGLGLAIARGFTEAMGGRVDVEETPGGGATFVVTLSRAHESLGDDPAAERSHGEPA